MKKVLWFLILVLLTLNATSQSVFRRGVKIGNDKTGSDVVLIDSATTQGSDVTFYKAGSILNARNVDTVSLSDLAVMQVDSNTYGGYVTIPYLNSHIGSGAGYSKYKLQFVVGATGFPADGDSSVIHTSWEGKELELFRDGLSQRFNSTITNTVDGFRLNNSTGEIIVNPAFSEGEIVKIDAYDPVNVEWLTLSGTESVLLDSLVAYWKLDESSGTLANDSYANFDGSHSATGVTVNQVGKIGMAVAYNNGTTSIPYVAGLSPTGSIMSFGCWFNLTELPGTSGHPHMLMEFMDGSGDSHSLYVYTDNKIYGMAENTSGTEYYVNSDAISASTWYYAVVVVNGATPVRLYVGTGTSVTPYTGGTFSGTLRSVSTQITLGNVMPGYSWHTHGLIDEVIYSHQAFTSSDIALLFNGGNGLTYPFN